ncbi:head to tail joining protein [Pasteurella phage vB_PmuP_Pa7]|uniref:Portal protein n=1 Tax=Pasteurella phage vB_PmuP_Pa7 TaxID=2767198 RepID=A0A7G8ZYR4_9CAUD|nr:head to tail joining protein [Pasteurella phage vB_PmuP_Pa7]
MANSTVKREGTLAEEGAEVIYKRLENDRKPYETRAESCAKVTIPSIFPKESDNDSTNYQTPYQSVGARGLNNLASKLMLALFPMQTWFKLSVSEFVAKKMTGDNGTQLNEVNTGLAMIERVLMNYIEANSYRVVLFEALKQLVVSGNALLYVTDPRESGNNTYNPLKLYKLNKFVVQRDTYGNVLQIITKDSIAYSALPEDIRSSMSKDGEHKPDEQIDLYTHIYLDEESNTYQKYEEIDGEVISGTEAEYPIDACPFIPVRMVRLDGESYGRSYCEEYIGDLNSLESLTKAIIEMSAISAKVVFLVNPAGMTQPRKLNKAKNGDFVTGLPTDVTAFQVDKRLDFSITKQTADSIEARLGFAFMLNSAVQRTGERVTAEEIRYVASELEDTLGGVYSILSQELQMPLVKVLLKQLQATAKIPELPKEAIEPTVSTGLEALGRGQDFDKLSQCLAAWSQVANLAQDPDLNIRNIKERIATSIGIDTTGILLTDQEKQEMLAQQAAEQATMGGAQSLGAGAGALATSSPEVAAQAMDTAGMEAV